MSSRVPPIPPPVPERMPGLVFVVRLTPAGEFRFTSPTGGLDELLEITPDELDRMLAERRLPVLPEDGPELWESVRESAERLTPWRRELRVVTPRTNRDVWVRVHSVPRREADGTVVWTGLVADVTDLKTAKAALAQSEARLRSALASAQMMGWDMDLRTGLSYFSADYAAFYGLPTDRDYSRAENGWLAVHPDDVGRLDGLLKGAFETGEDLDFEYRGRVPRADGVTRWFATRGQVFRDPDGRPARVVAVTTDITDRKLAEREREALDRQLLDAQKWESLGVLAGGVAHEFNNILTIILGNAGLTRRALPPTSPAAAFLDQIETASRRAADLCRQLLAYSGRGQVSVGRTDLNRLIRESAALLEVPASRQARVRFDLANDLPPVEADPAQVRQVLINLVMNAAEAVGAASGEVGVRTRVTEVADPDPGYRIPPAPGRYVELEVTDTGPGISPEAAARMFDPFFTTKFAGRGLGLAAVLGIVRAHRGTVRVDSEPGRGTTVRVLWPLAPTATGTTPPPRPEPVSPKPAPPPGPTPRATGGTALVIDDEMFVREVAASTLEDAGYEPLLAADGPAGLDLFRQHRGSVRVAVIDVVMPGMAGDQVLAQLRAIEPRLPAVLVSGFTDGRATPTDARTAFVQKPFRPEELAAAVERVVAPGGP